MCHKTKQGQTNLLFIHFDMLTISNSVIIKFLTYVEKLYNVKYVFINTSVMF